MRSAEFVTPPQNPTFKIAFQPVIKCRMFKGNKKLYFV